MLSNIHWNIDKVTKAITITLAILITIAAINNILNEPSEIEPWIRSIHYM